MVAGKKDCSIGTSWRRKETRAIASRRTAEAANAPLFYGGVFVAGEYREYRYAERASDTMLRSSIAPGERVTSVTAALFVVRWRRINANVNVMLGRMLRRSDGRTREITLR